MNEIQSKLLKVAAVVVIVAARPFHHLMIFSFFVTAKHISGGKGGREIELMRERMRRGNVSTMQRLIVESEKREGKL